MVIIDIQILSIHLEARSTSQDKECSSLMIIYSDFVFIAFLQDKYQYVPLYPPHFSNPSFRKFAIYVEILARAIVKDVLPFSLFFSIFLISFSGAFYLALRGESRGYDILTNSTQQHHSNTTAGETAKVATSLDIHPYETK